ncbi:MAG: thioredoxin domain-containing protein [Candidatus Bathyarchaeia archaeon]
MDAERRLAAKPLPILRMECPTCIPLLEREAEGLDGVEEARGSYLTRTLRVTYDPARIQLPEIEAAIERVGYRIAYKRYPGLLSRIKGLLRRGRPAGVEALSDADFPAKVLGAAKPVAVLFTTPTCPICRALRRLYGEAAERLRGEAELYEMDIASTETWRRYGIATAPTVLLFGGGEVAGRFTALPRRGEIEEALRSVSLDDKV